MTENDKKMKISIIHLSKAADNGEHDISKYMYMILNFPALDIFVHGSFNFFLSFFTKFLYNYLDYNMFSRPSIPKKGVVLKPK